MDIRINDPEALNGGRNRDGRRDNTISQQGTAPMIAGATSHLACRRTRAYKEKIPPSPLLSARRVSTTYLNVVCKVSVQRMHDNAPYTTFACIGLSPIIALKTYSGEVPISP